MKSIRLEVNDSLASVLELLLNLTLNRGASITITIETNKDGTTKIVAQVR